MLLYILPVVVLIACAGRNEVVVGDTVAPVDTVVVTETEASLPDTDELDSLSAKLEAMGFVDLHKADPSLVIDLMYATDSNFVGENMYLDFRRAYLHPDAARALLKAQAALHEVHPGYNIVIKDATRPMSVQRRMYNVVRGTSKARYVSNPANGGGMHNYGLAVDVTLADSLGRELSMGTPVDHLGPEAGIRQEAYLVKSGAITEQERLNRELLRRIMIAGGFKPLSSEWWHFNLVSRAVARAKYKVIDF